MDCCWEQGQKIRITIGPSQSYDPSEPLCLPEITELQRVAGLQDYTCTGNLHSGKYVKIHKTYVHGQSDLGLVLCEVKVFTSPVTTTTPSATTTTTTTSTTTTTTITNLSGPCASYTSSGATYIADPSDPTCTSFITCVSGAQIGISTSCGAGLKFSYTSQTCDWPSNVPNCGSNAPTTATTTTATIITTPGR